MTYVSHFLILTPRRTLRDTRFGMQASLTRAKPPPLYNCRFRKIDEFISSACGIERFSSLPWKFTVSPPGVTLATPVKINGALTFPFRQIRRNARLDFNLFREEYSLLDFRKRRRLRRRGVRDEKAGGRDETREALMIGFKRISTRQIWFRCPRANHTHSPIHNYSIVPRPPPSAAVYGFATRGELDCLPYDHLIILYVNKNGCDTARFPRCTLVSPVTLPDIIAIFSFLARVILITVLFRYRPDVTRVS